MTLETQPELHFSTARWSALMRDLWLRSEASHESGAFLLGTRERSKRFVVEWVLYDDFDEHSLDSGIVTLQGDNLGKLWQLCREKNLQVVADVHTHPGLALQSASDMDHPMIAVTGHLALIIPRYAKPPVRLENVCLYSYRGEKKWARLHTGNLVIGAHK